MTSVLRSVNIVVVESVIPPSARQNGLGKKTDSGSESGILLLA
jgi:hypothetical protein